MNADPFNRSLRQVGLTWVALLALMLLSLASAYLRLGWFNGVSGLLIAAVKAGVVVWLFMRLRTSSSMIRLVAVVGVVVWLVLAGLSGVDYLTRTPDRATMQPPLQLRPTGARPFG